MCSNAVLERVALKHLIFLTTSYPRYEGDEASIFVARLAESLVSSADGLDVVVPLDASEPVKENRNGVSIHRFKYRFGSRPGLAFDAGLVANLRARPWQLWHLISLIFGLGRGARRLSRINSVIVANWILAAWAAGISYLIGGARFIYIVRGQEMRLLGGIVGRCLFGFPLKLASNVVCVSETFCRQLKSRFPHHAQKILFIPNGITVDVHAELPTADFRTDSPYLLMIGTVTAVKDLKRAIDLFRCGLSQKFNLVVIGRLNDRQYIREIEDLVEQNGLAKQVHLLGEVSPQQISSYLLGARSFISTSIHEGMPNALLEAMALGRVVIVSDISAHREVVKDNESGLVLSGDSIRDADRILRVLDDVSLQKKLGSAAIDVVKARSWASTAQKYIELFVQV
jgi:glycosyltransferase involved in cell wall biosynthesis